MTVFNHEADVGLGWARADEQCATGGTLLGVDSPPVTPQTLR